MATLRARSSSSRGRHARSRLVPCERPPRRAETTASRRNRTARQRSVESHADRQPGGLSSSGIEALVRCGERKRIRAKRSDRQARVVATRLPALGRTRLPHSSASERPRRHPAGTRSGRPAGAPVRPPLTPACPWRRRRVRTICAGSRVSSFASVWGLTNETLACTPGAAVCGRRLEEQPTNASSFTHGPVSK